MDLFCQCHKLAPLCFYNGNTFIAIARIMIQELLPGMLPVKVCGFRCVVDPSCFPFGRLDFGAIGNPGFGQRVGLSLNVRFQHDTDTGVEHRGHAAQHAEGMTFVTRRFKPADLLLRRLELAGEVALRKAGLFAQGGELQGHVPRLTRLLEPPGKCRVFQLRLEVAVKVCLFHVLFRFNHGVYTGL